MTLSAENRALVVHVFAGDLPYTDREGMILSEDLLNRLLDAARTEASPPPPAEGVGKLVEALRTALRRSAEGWANAIELKLIPARHVLSAVILRDEALAAAEAASPVLLEGATR